MDPSTEAILTYCQQNSTAESDLLRELERTTHLTKLEPEMLAGYVQGRFLSFVSIWLQPKKILEIGTYTGYSALCLAEGLAPNGRLDTIERNPEHEDIINTNINKSPLGSRIHLTIGDAFDIVPKLEHKYDLIFLDGAKKHYCEFYDLIFPKLKIGGTLIADNVLWYGNILAKKKKCRYLIHRFFQ